MKHKKAHIFSLQSLVDMDEYVMQAWDEILTEHGLEIDQRSIHAWKFMHPQKVEEALEEKLEKPYLSFLFLKQACDERFLEKLKEEKIILKEGALDYLQNLKEKGKFLALISAKDKNAAEKVLKHFSLNYYFDAILYAEDHAKQILKPALFSQLLEERSFEKEAAVTYASTSHAVKTSRQAKIDCIYIPNQKQNKRSFDEGIYTVQSLKELDKGVQ